MKESLNVLVGSDFPSTVDRLAAVPAIYRTNHERLACELALKIDPVDEVFGRYGYTPEQAVVLLEQPAFSGLLEKISKEVAETGLSFRNKVRAIAEDLLPEAYAMATDITISSAVRTDIIKWAAKVGGLEPKEKDDGRTSGGMTLNITFSGQAPQAVITHEPLTIEG